MNTVQFLVEGTKMMLLLQHFRSMLLWSILVKHGII